MQLTKHFPYIVAGYIIAVGIFFCVSTLMQGAILDPEPPGKHLLLVVSIIFMGAGIVSIFLFKRGKLKKAGKPVSEVRREAVEKLKDPAMLAQIAIEERNPVIQKTAENRLKELNNN